MRRLAARWLGGPEDTKPAMRRARVAVIAGGLVAALLLLTATVVVWSRDRPAAPASVQAPPATRAPPDPAALQRQLDKVVEAGTPGVVALVRSGHQTWQGASGLGNLDAKRPARAGDRFRIGSMTKSFVATVALQLVGEHKLGLDDHLERWLPRLVPNGDHITVRQLLNHTSGLYDYSDDLPEPPRSFQPRELVAIATGHRPLFAPGKRFSYSNTNYILAGLVIERVTGQRLATQLQQRIFGPLDLDGTELPLTEQAIASPYVHGYAPRDKDWQVTDGPAGLVDVTKMDPSWAWAAGAMVSTTADLAHFYQALLGGQLLDPEQLRAMQTTVDASDQLGHGAGYGLGLMLLRPGCATELWGHGGALAGYRTTAFSTKDADRQLVTMTNLQPEPDPFAAQSAVDNLLRREVSC
jgi:D-alanyl-D-alanine carboxypeptidase